MHVAPSRRGVPPELPCCFAGKRDFSAALRRCRGLKWANLRDCSAAGCVHRSCFRPRRGWSDACERGRRLSSKAGHAAGASPRAGEDRVGSCGRALGSRPVRSSRRSCRHWQDRAAGGGAARGDRRRHARASCTRHGDGAGLRVRCCPAAFRASIGRCVRHRSLGLLQGAAGVAARILGLPGAPAPDASEDSTVDPSFAVLHGLYWLCANLAADEPLCLIVDDAHWMDGPSRRYLSFLLTRLDELQVALVLATRPFEPGSDAELLAALTADPAADLIQLPPLTGAAIAELVTADLGSAPDPSFVDACLRATGGTPFLVRVLLDALKEGSIEPTSDAWRHVERIGARTAGRSINIRLRRLPEPAGQLAHALALLEQSTLLEASQLARLDVDEAADAAQILESAGILELARPLRFVHPLIRSGIYAELSPAERGRGHRRAAHILAEQPGTGIPVAQHLLLSDPAGDAWASDRLLAAAGAAGLTATRVRGRVPAAGARRAPARREAAVDPARSGDGRGQRRRGRLERSLATGCRSRRTPRRPPPRRWCSVSLSAGHSARGRLSRFSIVLPRRSMRATRHSHSWQGVRLSSPR